MKTFERIIKEEIILKTSHPLDERQHGFLARNRVLLRGRLQRTSGKWGGGGFEISDIPGRGEGVVCESSDVRKFLKKSKFQ